MAVAWPLVGVRQRTSQPKLNLILSGWAGMGDTWHIVPFYGPLPADPDDGRYWGERSPAVCGRQVRIRMGPANLPPAAAVAQKRGYMPVETWRKEDVARACRQCLDHLDAELRALLGLDEPP